MWFLKKNIKLEEGNTSNYNQPLNGNDTQMNLIAERWQNESNTWLAYIDSILLSYFSTVSDSEISLQSLVTTVELTFPLFVLGLDVPFERVFVVSVLRLGLEELGQTRGEVGQSVGRPVVGSVGHDLIQDLPRPSWRKTVHTFKSHKTEFQQQKRNLIVSE